jgi:hypothetical protein
LWLLILVTDLLQISQIPELILFSNSFCRFGCAFLRWVCSIAYFWTLRFEISLVDLR